MRIADILRGKGDQVVTIAPERTIKQLLDALAEYGVGALVVSEDGQTVAGIVSERDVVRHLQQVGAEILDAPVRQIMTAQVHVCAPCDSVDDMMRIMTDRRIRHVPVVVDDQMIGIVSIGDIVKHRIGELTSERDHLSAYINASIT